MFKKNRKGQGALEYLLLIGGAVLIAVIVIALLVGMGGQSRETANTQAENAQQSLDMPQPASIVAVTSDIANCAAVNLLTNGQSCEFTINWQGMGDSGTYTMKLYNYQGEELILKTGADFDASDDSSNPVDNSLTLEDVIPGAPIVYKLDLDSTSQTNYAWIPTGFNPQDSYWAEITTEKNGKFVTSVKYKVDWN
ncbi:class III signal peptide-containing protein [archaeon]|nr:class III signal peptide-containing protein [archaeon]